jgi:YD repeat-containing protein
MFGPTWSANYELPRLQYTTSNCLYQPDTGWCLPREAFLTHPDGTRYRYEPQLATDPAEYRVRGAAATGSLYYTPTRWRLTLEKTTYTFSRTGILERLQTDTGTHQLTFSYSSADPTKLLRVTNRVGQSVSFTWTGERVTRVTDPGGNAWQYGYTADLRLASVTPPGAASPERVYHYEDAATPSC